MERSASLPALPSAYLVRADYFSPIDLTSPMERTLFRPASPAAVRAKQGTNFLGGADLMKKKNGPIWMTAGPMQWQYQGRWGWVDCDSAINSVMEHAYMSGNPQCSVWSTSGLLSFDFEMMIEMPGHRRIRRIEGTKPADDTMLKKEDQALEAAPCELKRCSDILRFQTPPRSKPRGRERAVTPPAVCRRLVKPQGDSDADKTPRKSPSKRFRPRSSSMVTLHSGTAGALQKLVHPDILRMEEPRFHCGNPGVDLLPLGVVEANIENVDLDPADVISELAKEYAARLRVPSLMLPVKGTAKQMMAALCIALHQFEGIPWAITFYTDHDSPDSRAAFFQVRDAWIEWRKAIRKQLGFQLEGLEQCDGSFSWIREEGPGPHRLTRLMCACASLCHALNMPSVKSLIAGTVLLSWFPRSRKPGAKGFTESQLAHANRSALQVAAQYECDGFTAAAVVEASGYTVGGRLLNGSAHGIEEEACTQSTLFSSLCEASRRAKAKRLRDSSGRSIHIPQDGAVLSPGVEVFRHCSREGYRPFRGPVKIAAALCISIPNVSGEELSTAPAVRMSLPSLQQVLRQKFEMVVQGADRVGAEVLIVPDVGCSELGNCPAEIVGHCLGQVLRSDSGDLRKVVLTGRQEFQRAVFNAVSGRAEN